MILQSGIFLALVAIILLYWWQRENAPAEALQPKKDIVRLSLEEATIYQFSTQGTQKTILKARTIAKLKNGDTHFYHPVLIEKNQENNQSNVKIWQVNAQFAEQRKSDGLLILQDQVVAAENEAGRRNLVLQTDKLIYDSARGEVRTDAPILLTTPESKTTATGLNWQIKAQVLHLNHNIRSHYAPVF